MTTTGIKPDESERLKNLSFFNFEDQEQQYIQKLRSKNELLNNIIRLIAHIKDCD